ncbi:MAG: penicillin acylase family protein [Candidatus Krumholzibacteriia bacterium]
MLLRSRPGRRLLLIVVAAPMALVVVAALSLTFAVRGSLPRLDGSRTIAGLRASVTVTRDSLGVPDVTAAGRDDAALALGWLHAQDRFFQMDLQRRSAAGELAALLGPALLETDRDHRRHRFRSRAAAVLAAASDRERAVVQAYAAGVNAGLADLTVRPWEYVVLRRQPAPWQPEDTVLALHAMFMDLSLVTAEIERSWACVRDRLPAELATFLLPTTNRWEAPLETDPAGEPEPVALPDSAAVDVRRWDLEGLTRHDHAAGARADTAGSNNWAVAGHLTAHGGALLANDMHLGLGLPNVWYRARMSWPEGSGRRAVVGITLPGTPALVAGSNGDVAWGFTNSYGDWVDLVVVETDSADTTRYRTPAGWRPFEQVMEVIQVAGAEPDTVTVTETVWGPVWTRDGAGRRLALRWTAHDTEAVDLALLDLESARDVDEAVARAARAGIPPQNLVCADRSGRIAWTIAGRIPRRVGWDGRLPESWADGRCRWDGYLAPDEQPRIVDPAEGRLWTANNRVTAGAHLAVVGDGGYGLGARARQIRDGLRALDRPTEDDMLALQLDDRALFLGEWRDLVLAVLEQHADGLSPRQAEFLRVVRDRWEGRAVPGSVSYRLVRSYAFACVDAVYEVLTGPCRAADADFDARWLPFRHAVTWELLTRRPPHLVPPGRRDWDDFVMRAVEQVMVAHGSGDPPRAERTWGEMNAVRVAHPLTHAAPWLARWLSAPAQALPGDSFMPRVQRPRAGASERLVVSPGREEAGFFHMPGGQSGHPLSPFFLAGHDAWAEGRATPLLPGPERHRLELLPE